MSVPVMTAKGEWRGQPDGNGQLLYSFPPTRILATTRSLSNIFLHRRQNSEKVGENSFAAALKLWKDGGIRAFFLMVQVKRQNQPRSNEPRPHSSCLPLVRAMPCPRAGRFE
jgi:hypothetical protein